MRYCNISLASNYTETNMENLATTLEKLQEALHELETVLAEEIKQLSGARVDPVALQHLSDAKSRLLSTVAFYDEQRKQQEDRLQLFAPYTAQATLAARWAQMMPVIKKSSEMNYQTSQLLEMHMQKAQQFARAMEKTAVAAPKLYNAGGQSENKGTSRSYNIII